MNTSKSSTVMANFVLGFSLTLIAFNLRPVFSSLSVLLPDILRDLEMSSLEGGILTTLPVLCLGLFAPLAPYLSQKIGAERTLFVALILLAIGLILRSTGQVPFLYLGAIFAGAGIALGNVLLPGVIKRDFPHQLALMTSLYTMALCGGAALAVGTTVPIMHFLSDSWQKALGFWFFPVFIVMILWLPQLKSKYAQSSKQNYKVKGFMGDPIAWQVTFYMGLQSSLAYCVFGWLAPILVERGIEITVSGTFISVSIIIQALSCLVTPLIASRLKTQSWLNVILCIVALIGLLGFIFAPLSTMWIWVFVQGIGQGGLIAAAMMMIVLRARDAHVASYLSGMAQCIGYCLAAIGPLLVGLVHDWTGRFEWCSLVFLGFGFGAAIAGFYCGRNRYTNTQTIFKY
ncbi:CynX/NimT family MFS transporter [Bartonella tamiae]|uniref:Cyanate transporter n=1 Tax=Bartonella tamiae Th239 TaxID=1094558 RepID=J1JZK4_9HYPH|nr:MFS transporter [Bartonella tamiae]EJF90557.1 cyanate transporter [Bartonella tamiae Th239]EJF94065.1 cyanate transporter [Bartonella tamiae Th307]